MVNRAVSYKELTVEDWIIHRKINRVTDKQINRKKEVESSDYGTPEEIFEQRHGIVHRLDKDTSGILLLAKHPESLVELLRQFRDREVHKEYTALVHGKLQPEQGSIRLPLARSSGDYTKFGVDVDGKVAETAYAVSHYYSDLPAGIAQKKGKMYQGFSLVTLHPKTGRTHQIRVHLAAIKFPIVGDGVYVGRKRAVVDKQWCPRQFLHASAITFTHPMTKKEVSFAAPLAPDLVEVLKKLSDYERIG